MEDDRYMNIVPKDDCTGCGACCAGCPVDAIRMEPDEEGFAYPVMVDKSLCTNCGRCARACPVRRAKTAPPEDGTRQPAFYAASAQDETVRYASTSGGVFTLLSRQVLAAGGAVFGAALSEDLRRVEHICVEDETGLERLRKSKYMQSSTGGCYRQVEALLRAGRQVLFSGTACQIEGLKSYLGRDHEGLYCADVFCFGVPSPKLWERYVQYREEKAGAALRSVTFRDKVSGWTNYSLTMAFDDGAVRSETQGEDLYMRAFLQRVALRPSCYHCAFKGTCREADVTLGDLWGAGEILPEWDDDKGVSLLLVHSGKGQALFEQAKGHCRWQAVDGEAALAHNPMAVRSAIRPPQRDELFLALDRMPFDELVEKYARKPEDSWKRKLWRALHRRGIV